VPAVHTEVLAGRGETCTWLSAADGQAIGDRVLASLNKKRTSSPEAEYEAQMKIYFITLATDLHRVITGRSLSPRRQTETVTEDRIASTMKGPAQKKSYHSRYRFRVWTDRRSNI